MFFPSRRRRGPDFHLDWKIRLFFFGALLAFIGIGVGEPLLVYVAIGVLLVGVLIRFLPGGDENSSQPGGDDDSDGLPRDPSGGGPGS